MEGTEEGTGDRRQESGVRSWRLEVEGRRQELEAGVDYVLAHSRLSVAENAV